MGFLDRIKATLSGGSVQPAEAGPQGPLALTVGDVVRYYSDQWVVSGVRALDGPGQALHHYCLRDELGAWAVLSVGEASGFWLERRVELPPPGDVVEGLADEPLRQSGTGTYRCRVVGDTEIAPARSVRVDVFVDEEGESRLVVESHDGLRTARLGESVFEGELAFGDDSAAADQRPWAAVAVGESDDTTRDGDTAEDVLARAPKGTPGAAAAALEGRLAPSEGHPTAPIEVHDVDFDREGYADDEWCDAQDDAPAAQRYRAHRDGDDDGDQTCDDWLVATRWVAGAAEEAHCQDDDWLSD